MRDTMAFLARRILTNVNSPASRLRYYCSPPLSSGTPRNNKLFVGGLSWSVDEKSLKEAFSSFGEVTEVKIMYDKDTGRSRGFGFVNFSTEDDAISAKGAMDGKVNRCLYSTRNSSSYSQALLGRPLRISFALENVRGGPVVVPRLSNIREVTTRKT